MKLLMTGNPQRLVLLLMLSLLFWRFDENLKRENIKGKNFFISIPEKAAENLEE